MRSHDLLAHTRTTNPKMGSIAGLGPGSLFQGGPNGRCPCPPAASFQGLLCRRCAPDTPMLSAGRTMNFLATSNMITWGTFHHGLLRAQGFPFLTGPGCKTRDALIGTLPWPLTGHGAAGPPADLPRSQSPQSAGRMVPAGHTPVTREGGHCSQFCPAV